MEPEALRQLQPQSRHRHRALSSASATLETRRQDGHLGTLPFESVTLAALTSLLQPCTCLSQLIQPAVEVVRLLRRLAGGAARRRHPPAL